MVELDVAVTGERTVGPLRAAELDGEAVERPGASVALAVAVEQPGSWVVLSVAVVEQPGVAPARVEALGELLAAGAAQRAAAVVAQSEASSVREVVELEPLNSA
jgi:hypothetical protein